MAEKKIFIIPGFKQKASDSQYNWLISHVRKNGWKPIQVPIHWNNRTLSQNANDFIEFFNKNKGEQNQILGFSYGAVIALMTANRLKPEKLFLCSLSPDFKEDQEMMSSWIKKYIGIRRYKDVATRSATQIAKNINMPTTIFYGEREASEYPSLKVRCDETAEQIKKAKLIIVPDAPHKIDFPSYKEAILRELT